MMADNKYGKFGSSYSREISMHIVGKNLNNEQYALVLDMCNKFKKTLVDAMDDVDFEFPQTLEVELSHSDRRG